MGSTRHAREILPWDRDANPNYGAAPPLQAISLNLVSRDELWITTKLWNTYHAKEHVEEACRRSLRDLGLDFIDLYLMHFPISLRPVLPWPTMPPALTPSYARRRLACI